MEKQANNPLHGVTLETMLKYLIDKFSWEELYQQIPVKCFKDNPDLQSSLKFFRKTPWAKKRIEDYYLYINRKSR